MLNVPLLMVALFQLNTEDCVWFLKVPLFMVNTPPSSFFTVLMPPVNVPPLIVSVGLASLVPATYPRRGLLLSV